jgi:lathosterol oxidase
MNAWIVEIGFLGAFAVMLAMFLVRATLVAGGAQLWLTRSAWAKARQIAHRAEAAINLRQDFWPALRTMLLDAVITALFLAAGWLKAIPEPTHLQVWSTFFVLFLWLEIYFYYSHRLMHTRALFWIHAEHHSRKATNPFTSLAFSSTERMILLLGSLGIPALFSQWQPLPLQGLGLYFLFNYVMNVYGHLNVEVIPPSHLNHWLGRVANTTTYHALHHEQYRGHFGLFTQVLDRFHGTRFAEYEARQAQAYGKNNLFVNDDEKDAGAPRKKEALLPF